jgi:hypothetical protein
VEERHGGDFRCEANPRSSARGGADKREKARDQRP